MLKMQQAMKKMDALEADTPNWAEDLLNEFDAYYHAKIHKNTKAIRRIIQIQKGEEAFLQAIHPDFEFKDVNETYNNDLRLHTQTDKPKRKRAKRKHTR